MISIRPAQLDDAQAIARCHIAAWRDTYRPIIADEYLANLSLDEHTLLWIDRIQRPGCYTFVAERRPGELIGLINGGPERNDRSDYRGEIYGMYIRKEFRAQGIGRKLLQKFAAALVQDRITTLIVWAFERNPCRAAYAAWGGVEIGRDPIKVGQQDLIEVGYGWRDISGLVG
jgi:GNAT superfamily N-acetyltransferase